jgi:hypothetical protein
MAVAKPLSLSVSELAPLVAVPDRAGGRKAGRRDGAFAELALERQVAAMELGERRGQRQPEAHALVSASQAAIDLREGPESDRDVGRSHADPRIPDLYVDSSVIPQDMEQLYVAATGRELDRVG